MMQMSQQPIVLFVLKLFIFTVLDEHEWIIEEGKEIMVGNVLMVH